MISAACANAACLTAQAADTSYFVTTDRGDTIGVEEWVIANHRGQHPVRDETLRRHTGDPPLTFDSMAGFDLALRRARRARRDSASVMQEPQHSALGMRFVGRDSASAGDYRMRVGSDGKLLGVRNGTAQAIRVTRLDMHALAAGFRAADSLAASAKPH